MKNSKTFKISMLSLFILVGCTGHREVSAPTTNTFRFHIGAKINSLDPAVTNDVYSSVAQAMFYEPLYEWSYLKRPLELQPLIAESLPKVSADGKTFIFKLKQGVRFHDHACFEGGKGREVTAEDFIYMIERIAAPKFSSPMFGSFEHRIAGIDEYHAGKSQKISGLKALDQHTVELKLTQKLPRFVYNFSDMKTAIVPKECVEKLKDEFSTHPVGTGAFLPKEINLGSKIVAEKNPNYKHATFPKEASEKFKALLVDSGKALPLSDKVILEVITESQPAWLKFMSGELELSAIPKDNFASALPGGKLAPELEKRGIVHYREPKGDVTVMIFNMDDAVWGKKKELRQAVALALDVPKMISIQYAGQAIRAHSIVDPTMYGFDANFKSKWAERNIEKAKELLVKAGYPEGKGLPPLVMPTLADTTSRQLDELMSRQLADVGIKLQPEAMTWPELDRRLRTKNFVMCGIGYASGIPDFDDGGGILHSRNVSPGSNAANYRNAEVDKLVDEIERSSNGSERLAKIHRVQEILDDELPYLPMTHRIGNQLAQPWLKNHTYMDVIAFGPAIKYERVETRAK